jgi:hypothetical protein
MSQQRIRVKRRATSTVPDDILTDPLLSWPARVVLGWMLGRSPEFELHVWYLRKLFKLSEKQWVRIRRNLEQQGYFLQQREKGKEGQFIWTNTVSDQAEFLPPPHKRGDGPPPLKRPDGQPSDGNLGDKPVGSNSTFINTTTTNQVVVDEEIKNLVDAAVWAATSPIKNEAGYRRAVRLRILENGVTQDDLQALEKFKKASKEKERRAQEDAAQRGRANLNVDPVAQAKGEQLLPPHLRQIAAKNHHQEEARE